ASNANHGFVCDSASDCSLAANRPIHTLGPRNGGTASGETLATPGTSRSFAMIRSCATKFVVAAQRDHVAVSAAVDFPPLGSQSTEYCRHGNEKLSIITCSVA